MAQTRTAPVPRSHAYTFCVRVLRGPYPPTVRRRPGARSS